MSDRLAYDRAKEMLKEAHATWHKCRLEECSLWRAQFAELANLQALPDPDAVARYAEEGWQDPGV